MTRVQVQYIAAAAAAASPAPRAATPTALLARERRPQCGRESESALLNELKTHYYH